MTGTININRTKDVDTLWGELRNQDGDIEYKRNVLTRVAAVTEDGLRRTAKAAAEKTWDKCRLSFFVVNDPSDLLDGDNAKEKVASFREGLDEFDREGYSYTSMVQLAKIWECFGDMPDLRRFSPHDVRKVTAKVEDYATIRWNEIADMGKTFPKANLNRLVKLCRTHNGTDPLTGTPWEEPERAPKVIDGEGMDEDHTTQDVVGRASKDVVAEVENLADAVTHNPAAVPQAFDLVEEVHRLASAVTIPSVQAAHAYNALGLIDDLDTLVEIRDELTARIAQMRKAAKAA